MPEIKNGEGESIQKQPAQPAHSIFPSFTTTPHFFRPTVRILCSGEKFEKGSDRRIIFFGPPSADLGRSEKFFFGGLTFDK